MLPSIAAVQNRAAITACFASRMTTRGLVVRSLIVATPSYRRVIVNSRVPTLTTLRSDLIILEVLTHRVKDLTT